MKVLAASDLHGNHFAYKWLAQTAAEKNVSLVILAGDLLGCPDGYDTVEAAQRADALVIIRILESTKVPIYFIMGNDDLVDLNPYPDWFQSLHGRRVEIGNLNLVGYQYSLPFMGGVFEKREEEIREDLLHLGASVDSKTVFVSHSPAYGVLDEGIMNLHAGSQSVLDLVRDRDVHAHIHGHIHRSFGRSGRHFNVAAGGHCRAMVIDLQTLEATIEGEGPGPS
jgi:Icc-related predicted phosphoesterase